MPRRRGRPGDDPPAGRARNWSRARGRLRGGARRDRRRRRGDHRAPSALPVAASARSHGKARQRRRHEDRAEWSGRRGQTSCGRGARRAPCPRRCGTTSGLIAEPVESVVRDDQRHPRSRANRRSGRRPASGDRRSAGRRRESPAIVSSRGTRDQEAKANSRSARSRGARRRRAARTSICVPPREPAPRARGITSPGRPAGAEVARLAVLRCRSGSRRSASAVLAPSRRERGGGLAHGASRRRIPGRFRTLPRARRPKWIEAEASAADGRRGLDVRQAGRRQLPREPYSRPVTGWRSVALHPVPAGRR